MKTYVKFLFFLSGIICAGCGRQVEEAKRIDMGEVKEEMTLNFSDLATDCRLVKLETRPDVLLEGWFNSWVGDKYIVTWGNEEMHLFTAEGKHLYRLSVTGRGPEEFQNIVCLTVDEQRDRLYFSDSRKGEVLRVIDLKTGCFLQPIELPCRHLCELALVDTVLYALPTDRDAEYELCRLSVSGGLLGGLINERRKRVTQNDSYLRVSEDVCRYMLYGNDTLFGVAGEVRKPFCYFSGLRSMRRGEDGSKGTAVCICYENEEGMLLLVQYLKTMKMGPGKFVYTYDQDPELCYVSLRDDRVRKVKGLYVEELQRTLGDCDLFFSQKYASQLISAMQFREWMEPEGAPYHAWYKEMTDDDNPVLLIGKLL